MLGERIDARLDGSGHLTGVLTDSAASSRSGRVQRFLQEIAAAVLGLQSGQQKIRRIAESLEERRMIGRRVEGQSRRGELQRIYHHSAGHHVYHHARIGDVVGAVLGGQQVVRLNFVGRQVLFLLFERQTVGRANVRTDILKEGVLLALLCVVLRVVRVVLLTGIAFDPNCRQWREIRVS